VEVNSLWLDREGIQRSNQWAIGIKLRNERTESWGDKATAICSFERVTFASRRKGAKPGVIANKVPHQKKNPNQRVEEIGRPKKITNAKSSG